MKLSKKIFAIAISLGISFGVQARDVASYVNSLQGTDSNFGLSHGNTYPTCGLPWGIHFWSPQTGPNGEGFKYTYAADEIRAFAQAHQCSPWVSDYAVYSFMPMTGNLVVNPDKRGAKFSHDNETAKPYYYTVKFDNGIATEISPSDRGAHFRFSYPKNGEDAWLVIDGYNGNSEISIDPKNRRVTGWVDNHRFVNHSENFRNYFVVEFDHDFADYGVWENVNDSVAPKSTAGKGKGYGAYLKFRPGAKVQAKAASSYISPEQAALNLKTELASSRRLEDTKAKAYKTWNDLLGNVDVECITDEDLRTFYSCLFRSSLFSRRFYEIDADGNPYYYSPYDGKIHQGKMFTDNGFWDTFRSQFPLNNIIYPTYQGEYMQALLEAQKQIGWLPAWSCPGETGGMLGNHAISLLADAYVKGIRTFDPDSALNAYAHEAFNKGPFGGANGRAGWKEYYQRGYVSFPESHGSTSQTLEYAYDDFCAWQLARLCGNKFMEELFGRQMYNYRNLFDKETGFMRGRRITGEWETPFDPLAWGGPYTEGNAWHYNWSVFHDVQGLIDLYGSDEAFVAKLDSVWTLPSTIVPGWYGGMIHEMKEMEIADMGQYAHGNQPIQHMPYLYCYAGQPWKTQKHVREIMSRLYNSTPQGFPGDEDQGGMSSWYVLSALGIYAVCPGTDQYVIGSPMVKRAAINLENGNKFIIEAPDNSAENVYVDEVTLNGIPLKRNYITHDEIMRGGTLHFSMTNQPNLSRNNLKSASPFSLSQR